jgi:leucyl aminopeptidase
MNFELKAAELGALAQTACDALIVVISKDFVAGSDALSVLIARALKHKDLGNSAGACLDIYRPLGIKAVRVVLAQAVSNEPMDARKAAVAAMALLKAAKPARVRLHFVQPPTPEQVAAVLAGLAESSYVYTTTKSKPQARNLQSVVLSAGATKGLKPGFDQAVATIQGIELAKEWGNRPANHATPEHLAKAARALAKRPNLQCEVLGPQQVAKLGMGSFQAVAQGSDTPLRFIVLRYNGAPKSVAPTVLIGKGITFDSGGISIKPAAEMDEMKFDMCGAAGVLGVFQALGHLQPRLNVVGLIPACENLPSSRALKPGDVVTTLSGQTVEVLNTDAEGRLILCDALTYAERFKPQAVIDLATLTGACVIALGAVRSGLFTKDSALSDALVAAGDAALDRCWPMPMDDDYAEALKSNFADVANVGGRAAGAVTAAKFLERFADKFPWAHLDIAGTAWKSGAAKGATGRPVGLLMAYLLGQTA